MIVTYWMDPRLPTFEQIIRGGWSISIPCLEIFYFFTYLASDVSKFFNLLWIPTSRFIFEPTPYQNFENPAGPDFGRIVSMTLRREWGVHRYAQVAWFPSEVLGADPEIWAEGGARVSRSASVGRASRFVNGGSGGSPRGRVKASYQKSSVAAVGGPDSFDHP